MNLDVILLLLLPAVFLAACVLWRFSAGQSNQTTWTPDLSTWLPLGCIGVLLIGSVFGHEFFNLKIGPLPITLDRVMLGGIIAMFAWQFLNHRQDLDLFNRVDMAILVWLVVITLSALTHKFTVMDNMPLSRLLFFNWVPVSLYFAIRWCRVKTFDLKCFSVLMVLFGVYLALTAIAETRGFQGLVFPRYIVESEFSEFLGRGRGPFLNPVTNGIFLSVTICCTLMWWPRLKLPGQIAVVGLSLLLAFGVYSTYTRSTWLGLAVGMVAFVFWPSKQHHKGAMIIAATLAGIALFPVVGEKIFSFKRDEAVSQADMEQSAQMRPLFASVALDMFKKNPIVGVGFAQYASTKSPYLQNPHSNLPLKSTRSLMQHNVFLAYLVDMGLVGLGVLILLLGQFSWVAWNVWSNRSLDLWARQFGLAGVVLLIGYCINGMFHDVSIIPMQHMLLFFWIGVINNIHSRSHTFESDESQTIRGPWQSETDHSMAA